MPAVTSTPAGAPIWIDLFTSDPDRAEQFYGRLFGWTAEHSGPEFGGYVSFTKDGERIAGMMRNDGSAGTTDTWTLYLNTPDAKSAVEAVVAAGGQVYIEPMQVADLGTMAVIGDPGGAAVGLWQPGTHTGFTRYGEPGTPVWHELHTLDYARVLDFYRTALGWQTQSIGDTDEFRYTQLFVDGVGYAGVMDESAGSGDGVATGWEIYLGSDDVDATLALAVELGGSVVVPAVDTPYGRLAKIADPGGVTIRVGSITDPTEAG